MNMPSKSGTANQVGGWVLSVTLTRLDKQYGGRTDTRWYDLACAPAYHPGMVALLICRRCRAGERFTVAEGATAVVASLRRWSQSTAVRYRPGRHRRPTASLTASIRSALFIAEASSVSASAITVIDAAIAASNGNRFMSYFSEAGQRADSLTSAAKSRCS